MAFPKRRFFGSELAGLVRVRYSAVQRELRRLERLGLLRRTSGPYRVFYHANRQFVLFQELKRLLTKAKGDYHKK